MINHVLSDLLHASPNLILAIGVDMGVAIEKLQNSVGEIPTCLREAFERNRLALRILRVGSRSSLERL